MKSLLFRRKNVGLVLGSGGARGLAHIGVIRALEQAGMEVGCVAGASMGALVGAALAGGRLDALESVARGLDWRQVIQLFAEFGLPGAGLIDGTRIVEFIRERIVAQRIEELALPYRAVACDLLTGREVVIGKGDVLEAIRASISVPGVFEPVRRDGVILVDGGLVNPVPVSVARAMGADRIVAVNVNRWFGRRRSGGRKPPPLPPPALPPRLPASAGGKDQKEQRRSLNEFIRDVNRWARREATQRIEQIRQRLPDPSRMTMLDVLDDSVRVMEARLAEVQLVQEEPDILIEPDLDDIGFLEFHRAEEAIAAGYAAARAVLQR